jgi:hypothetical protein
VKAAQHSSPVAETADDETKYVEVTCPSCECAVRVPLPPSVSALRLTTRRRAGRARFNGMLREFLEAESLRGNTLATSWADQLGVSDQHIYAQANPLQVTSVLAAGDLDALDPEDLLSLLDFWAERTRERIAPTPPARDPALFVLASASRTGQLATKVEYAVSKHSHGGERITGKEWRGIAKNLAEQERESRESKLAALAAAEVADREGRGR